MKNRDPKTHKPVPRYLIPGCGKNGVPGLIKRHVAMICAPIDDRWRLFAEGCLRNGYFRDQVLKRGPKCLACSRKLDDRSRIEQHHNDYLWTCIGPLLLENSEDVHRKPVADEYPQIPDCRQCHIDNPGHFAECRKRIYAVHAKCHERIHENERYFRGKARDDLKEQFREAAKSWLPVSVSED